MDGGSVDIVIVRMLLDESGNTGFEFVMGNELERRHETTADALDPLSCRALDLFGRSFDDNLGADRRQVRRQIDWGRKTDDIDLRDRWEPGPER